MKRIACMIVCAAACAAIAAPQAQKTSKKRINHVPDTPAGLNAFSTNAQKLNHIELVNVGGAVSDADWDVITRYVARAMPLNYWTNSIPQSMTADLFSGKIDRHETVLGEKAKVVVFVENDASKRPAFLSSPGRWASVNIERIVKSAPNRQTARDRVAKFLMRGIAFAVGGGLSTEDGTTLSSRVVSVAQLDETPIVCPPMSFFPLIGSVEALLGGEGTCPAPPEGYEEEPEESPTPAKK